jgi:hypothetical protein
MGKVTKPSNSEEFHSPLKLATNVIWIKSNVWVIWIKSIVWTSPNWNSFWTITIFVCVWGQNILFKFVETMILYNYKLPYLNITYNVRVTLLNIWATRNDVNLIFSSGLRPAIIILVRCVVSCFDGCSSQTIQIAHVALTHYLDINIINRPNSLSMLTVYSKVISDEILNSGSIWKKRKRDVTWRDVTSWFYCIMSLCLEM